MYALYFFYYTPFNVYTVYVEPKSTMALSHDHHPSRAEHSTIYGQREVIITGPCGGTYEHKGAFWMGVSYLMNWTVYNVWVSLDVSGCLSISGSNRTSSSSLSQAMPKIHLSLVCVCRMRKSRMACYFFYMSTHKVLSASLAFNGWFVFVVIF